MTVTYRIHSGWTSGLYATEVDDPFELFRMDDVMEAWHTPTTATDRTYLHWQRIGDSIVQDLEPLYIYDDDPEWVRSFGDSL